MLIGNLQLWYLSVQGHLSSFRETQGWAKKLVGCRALGSRRWQKQVIGETGQYTQRMLKWGNSQWAKILGIKEMKLFKATAG